jgi:adenylate cyclase, class 2
MIEVEWRFQPTEEQKEKLLNGAILLGEETNHDIYYDFPDFKLFTEEVKMRSRNDKFELKVKKSHKASDEITNEEEIKKYLKTNLSIKEFIDQKMKIFMDFKTKRKIYKKDNFNLNFDECDFGYEGCEIEELILDENERNKAESEIINLALSCGLEIKKVPTKSEEYLRKMKPEIYKELCVDRMFKEAFKIK